MLIYLDIVVVIKVEGGYSFVVVDCICEFGDNIIVLYVQTLFIIVLYVQTLLEHLLF